MAKRCSLTQLTAGNEKVLHVDNFCTAEAIDWLQWFLRLGFPIDGHVEDLSKLT
jgi:hypothetical protein